MDAYGTVDELNSALGILLSGMGDEENLSHFFKTVQSDLFSVGSHLAGGKTGLKFLQNRVLEMEKLIDVLDEELPELKNFILPSGTFTSSIAHFARAVCRRAERKTVALKKIDNLVIVYLNRLSDLLFITARYLNWKNGIKDTIWRK